jgi:hypothetical protein
MHSENNRRRLRGPQHGTGARKETFIDVGIGACESIVLRGRVGATKSWALYELSDVAWNAVGVFGLIRCGVLPG